MVARAVGFEGEMAWDASWPDGIPRKLLDVSRLTRMSGIPTIDLDTGLRSVYQWYRSQT
jgi:GDP-L-fucose synthase